MKRTHLLAALFLTISSATTLKGGPVEDAEVKRREAVVAQIRAEQALADEKQKTKQLEQKVASLEKELAALSGTAPIAATSASTKSASTAVSTTRPEALPWASLNFKGQRAAPDPAIYSAIVRRYISGDWATLAADLSAKQAEINALPEGNRADLKYIELMLGECHPQWWDTVKQGKPLQFRQAVFGKPGVIDYEPGDKFAALGALTKGNVSSTRLQWPFSQMDSRDTLEHGFTHMAVVSESGGAYKEISNNFGQGDGVNNLIWRIVCAASVIENTANFGKNSSPADAVLFDRHSNFLGTLAAAYYGNPAAQRLAIVQSSVSLDRETLSRSDIFPFRPLAAALLIEWKLHPEGYPSLGIGDIATNFTISDLGKNGEYMGADFLLTRNILRDHLTLAEDRQIRELAKKLADENRDWKISKIKLPNGLFLDLDPGQDAEYFKARLEFLESDPKKNPKQPL